MRRSYFFFFIIALGLVQSTFLNYFQVFGAKPDLFLITIVLASLYFDWRWSMFFSICAGLSKDISGLHFLGINTLLFIVWNITIVQLARKIALDSFEARLLLILVVAFLNNIITRLILIYNGSFVPLGISLRIVILGTIYTTAVCPLILKLVKPTLTER